MSLEIKYLDTPPGAQENMAVSATQINAMSLPSKIATGDRGGPWASLEPLGWPLDGSREILPDAPAVGYWSNKTSENAAGVLGSDRLGAFFLGAEHATAAFVVPPVIDLSFGEKYTATGITFTFSPETNEWCSEMLVQWYSGDTLLAEATVYPDAPRWTLKQLAESFDRICVTLYKTNKPGHFAKVQMIEIGQTTVFYNDELTRVQVISEIDPTLSELSVDTMTVEIQDKLERPLAPQENQRMELFRISDGVPTLMAAHYITKSSRQAKRHYLFSCQSAVGLLEDTFLGGMYVNADVDTVVADILGAIPYDLGPFAEAVISGYLPVCTRREALQQVAFAIGGAVSTQGTDKVQFQELFAEDAEQTFEEKDIFLGGSIDTVPRVCRVEAVAHSYVPSEEVQTLLDGEELHGDNVLLTFGEPHHGYTLSGGRILQQGANYVTVKAEGKVTLKAKTYIHNTVRHFKTNPVATAAEQNNVHSVENVTLVHSGNVDKILARLLLFANMRQTLKQDAVILSQRAGHKVQSFDPWGGTFEGYITRMASDLTQNGHTASVTVLGTQTEAGEVEVG